MEASASGVRVACRIPNASHQINGVRFGTAGENLMVSEPIADDVAAAFCRNPDFAVEGFEADVLERVDADIAAKAIAAGDSARAAGAEDASPLVEELRRANAAQATDIDRMQVEVADLRVKLSRSNAQEVERLQARVSQLEAEKGGGDSGELSAKVATLTEELGVERRERAEEKARLEGEVATLKQANEGLGAEGKRLADELQLARTTIEQLKQAAPPADAPAPDAAPASGKPDKAKGGKAS